MNGNSTGLEPADAGSAAANIERWRRALTLFNETAKAACDCGEHKLQREAEDAAARAVGVIYTLELDQVQQRRMDGEDPQVAR